MRTRQPILVVSILQGMMLHVTFRVLLITTTTFSRNDSLVSAVGRGDLPLQQHEAHHQQPHQSYEWEDWDYYTILGLDAEISQSYNAKDIRQAYRRQAQLWHPDKIMHRRKAVNDARNTSETTGSESQYHHDNENNRASFTSNSSGLKIEPTIEEGTARFARIAEAYEVLSHEDQRREYDQYVTWWRRQRRRQTGSSPPQAAEGSSPSSNPTTVLHPNFAKTQHREDVLDPFRTFQDFFFRDREEGFQEEYDPYFQTYFQYDHPYHAFRMMTEQRPPDRWARREQRYQHGYTEMQRVLETGLYYVPSGVYQCVWAHEHAYDGSFPSWHSPPVRVQEGFFPYQRDDDSDSDFNHYDKDDTDWFMSGANSWFSTDPSTLWPGTSMVPGSTMRTNHYVAQLSMSCGLSVIRFHTYQDDTDILVPASELVWSLEDYDVEAQAFHYFDPSTCLFQLQGSRLMLTAGTIPMVTLWSSEGPVDGDEKSLYVSRLDDDGCLAVYKLQHVQISIPWLARLWESSMSRPQILTGVWSLILGGRIWRMKDGQTYVAKCQSATGSPWGCSRLGRLICQLFRDVKHWIRRVNGLLDAVIEYLI